MVAVGLHTSQSLPIPGQLEPLRSESLTPLATPSLSVFSTFIQNCIRQHCNFCFCHIFRKLKRRKAYWICLWFRLPCFVFLEVPWFVCLFNHFFLFRELNFGHSFRINLWLTNSLSVASSENSLIPLHSPRMPSQGAGFWVTVLSLQRVKIVVRRPSASMASVVTPPIIPVVLLP